MNTLHLVFIALWGGVLASEALLEFLPVGNAIQGRQVADLHFRIDALLEAPLLVAILATGILLLSQATWSMLLALKVAGGLVVIGANVACIAVVVKRHLALRASASGDSDQATACFIKHTRSIHRIIFSFTPIGLGVFALGLALS